MISAFIWFLIIRGLNTERSLLIILMKCRKCRKRSDESASLSVNVRVNWQKFSSSNRDSSYQSNHPSATYRFLWRDMIINGKSKKSVSQLSPWCGMQNVLFVCCIIKGRQNSWDCFLTVARDMWLPSSCEALFTNILGLLKWINLNYNHKVSVLIGKPMMRGF